MTYRESPYRFFKDALDNGVRVLTVEIPYLHAAEIALYIRTGSRYETLETNGVSHFLEHMFFRGSRNYPSSFKLNSAFEGIGEGLIANTFREFTCYWSKIDHTHLAGGMGLFGDVFTKPIFEEIETERKIIEIELLEDFEEDGTPHDIDDITRPFIWPGNPLGFSVIGTKENIGKFQRDDLVSHYEKFYTPPNMVLCVAGRVTRSEVLNLAQEAFGHMKEGVFQRPPGVRMAQEFPMYKFVSTNSSQVDIQLSFRAYGELHPKMRALYLMQRVLDDGISSQLQKAICEDQGLAYDISASIDSYSDAGLFDIDVTVSKKDVTKIIPAILDELGKLKESVISDEEFKKIKIRAMREYEFSFDSLRKMSTHFGESELLYELKMPEEIIAEILKITKEDICAVAQDIFRSKNLNLITLGQLNDKQKEDLKKLLSSPMI